MRELHDNYLRILSAEYSVEYLVKYRILNCTLHYAYTPARRIPRPPTITKSINRTQTRDPGIQIFGQWSPSFVIKPLIEHSQMVITPRVGCRFGMVAFSFTVTMIVLLLSH